MEIFIALIVFFVVVQSNRLTIVLRVQSTRNTINLISHHQLSNIS
jgi:hypothetical protein